MNVVLWVIAAVVLANIVVVIALVRKYIRQQWHERIALRDLRPVFVPREDVTLAH